MAKNDLQTKIDRLNAAAEIIEKEHKPKKMSVSSEQQVFASVDRIKSCYRCEFEFFAWMLVDLAQDILMWIRRGDIC